MTKDQRYYRTKTLVDQRWRAICKAERLRHALARALSYVAAVNESFAAQGIVLTDGPGGTTWREMTAEEKALVAKAKAPEQPAAVEVKA